MATNKEIVLFHYSFSPYARRVVWYLALRGIKYSQCLQPPIMPREDLSALGISYRRIPIMSIGRDVYTDTRLIIAKLEQMFPVGALGAKDPEQKGIESLLEKWTVDGGIFARASQLIPPEMPMLRDLKFVKDREEFGGRSWKAEDMQRGRPEALVEIRGGFELLEKTLLADGRGWILKTEKPTLADIQAVWPFHWLSGLQGALDPSVISAEKFPKAYAWIARFNDAISAAKKEAGKPSTLKGADAVKQIVAADYAEPDLTIDKHDPLGLKLGQDILLYPLDGGSKHRDQGRLVGLSAEEVVIETQSKVGGREVRIHAPRHGFRVAAASGGAGAKL